MDSLLVTFGRAKFEPFNFYHEEKLELIASTKFLSVFQVLWPTVIQLLTPICTAAIQYRSEVSRCLNTFYLELATCQSPAKPSLRTPCWKGTLLAKLLEDMRYYFTGPRFRNQDVSIRRSPNSEIKWWMPTVQISKQGFCFQCIDLQHQDPRGRVRAPLEYR